MQIRQFFVALCCVMLFGITVSSVVETAEQARVEEVKDFTLDMAVEQGITYEDEVPEGYNLSPDVFTNDAWPECNLTHESGGFLGGVKSLPSAGVQ